ncbi:MAG: type II toxin-antitoxin system PemK/MazF family toxin [Candidatus Paceibacterota bacterium]|jgi:mRNA interferase MazF
MHKDFDKWNTEKKNLEIREKKIRFHEREIWWCSIGTNIGDEQDGKNLLFERPVLVLRKFNDKLLWAVPMTTKVKEGTYYRMLDHDGVTFSVILSQIRLLSVKRLQRRIRKINENDFQTIIDGIKGLF